MLVRTLALVVAMTAGSVNGRAVDARNGSADGSMTVAGKVSHLSHVHAFSKKVFGRPAVLLVFSDVALSAADAGNDARLSELGNAGKLHGMAILIGDDSEGKKRAISNEIYDQGTRGRMSIGGQDELEPRKSDDKSTSGRLYLKAPKTLDNGVTFTYDVTFDAAVEP